MRLATPDAQQIDLPVLARQALEFAGGEGCGETRQRVAAALGSPAMFFSVVLRQRRMASAVTPVSPAQSCKRREAFNGRRVTSPTTPARPLQRSPSSIAGRTSRVLPGLAIDDAIGMQADAREGRGEEIAAAQAPKHRAGMARENACGEQRREPGIFTGSAALDHLMQMAE